MDNIKSFINEPLLIFNAIKKAAYKNKTVDNKTKIAISESSSLLAEVDKVELRVIFLDIISGKNAGQGLKLLGDNELMDYILGQKWYEKMNSTKIENFNILLDRIDETNSEKLVRFSLFLSCLNKNSAQEVIKYLEFEKKEEELLINAIKEVDLLYYIGNPMELKKKIKNLGIETYTFYNKIAVEQNKIFERADLKTEAREYMLEEIQKRGEALFLDDLTIDETDLIYNNLAINREEAIEILDMLLDLVHIKPYLNTKEHLLKEAKSLSKNPFKKAFRKIAWQK